MKAIILSIIMLICSSGKAQTIQQLILSDSSNEKIPDSIIQNIKGKWNWTNGRDTFSISFIDNKYFNYKEKFGSPDLCALLGFWHYKRYNSVELGSRSAFFSSDSSLAKSNNVFNVFLGRFWKPKEQAMAVIIRLLEHSNLSLSMKLKLIDRQTMLLLFDSYTGERWSKSENDTFFEFLVPSNIVLTKQR